MDTIKCKVCGKSIQPGDFYCKNCGFEFFSFDYLEKFEIVDGELKKYNGHYSNIIIPNTITSIGDSAFIKCESLEKVVIPDSVTSIENRAFDWCKNLKEITLPDSIKEIGYSVFANCEKLEEIIIPNGITYIPDSAFWYCSSLKKVTIPNSVNSIGAKAFCNCSSLKSVIIPESVNYIWNNAFSFCKELEDITVPISVKVMGREVFIGCHKLTIKCKYASKPSKWDIYWNPNYCKVLWGYFDKERNSLEKKEFYKRNGNEIIFGSYYQNDNKNKDPILWTIIKEENGKALITTKYLVDSIIFDNDNNYYDESYIRNWLNSYFYNNAFDDIEKFIIQTTEVDNSLESTGDWYNKNWCDNTNDKVFLLSVLDIESVNDKELINNCQPTKYAIEKELNNNKGFSIWWLRSPSYERFKVYYVGKQYNSFSIYANKKGVGVRPAIWIFLDNDINNYLKIKEANNRKI